MKIISALLTLLLLAGAASAQPPPRVRGVIQALEGQTLIVTTQNQGTVRLTLTDMTGINGLEKRTMADIKDNTFVGATAVELGDRYPIPRFGTVPGVVVQARLDLGVAPVDAYRTVIVGYAVIGLAIGGLAMLLSRAVEPDVPAADASVRRTLGIHRSGRVVAELSSLFALDAFGGGFVVQSIVAVWFSLRWDVEPAVLGAIFFGANALAGLSGLVAARLAARFGLIRTMVGTHLPSNVLLILVPFMPTLELSIAVLLARFAISQMDVPTRQSYTMAVVDPDERSAAAGITGIARTAGAAAGTALAAPLVAASVLGGGLPFVIAGSVKIVYDLALWRRFRSRPAIDAGEPAQSGR